MRAHRPGIAHFHPTKSGEGPIIGCRTSVPSNDPSKPACSCLRQGPSWFPTARVQRGLSEAARCASTGDQQAALPLPLLSVRVPGARTNMGAFSITPLLTHPKPSATMTFAWSLSNIGLLLRRTMLRHLLCSRPRKILNVFQRIRLRFSEACGRAPAYPPSPRNER